MRKAFGRFLLLAGAAGIAAATPGGGASAQDSLEPFIGTIRYFGFNYAPRNWLHCDGQLLAIAIVDLEGVFPSRN